MVATNDVLETIHTIRLEGSGYLDFMAWSPDGKFLAVENEVSVWTPTHFKRGVVYIIDVERKEYTTLKKDKNASSIVSNCAKIVNGRGMRFVGDWTRPVYLSQRREVGAMQSPYSVNNRRKRPNWHDCIQWKGEGIPECWLCRKLPPYLLSTRWTVIQESAKPSTLIESISTSQQDRRIPLSTIWIVMRWFVWMR